MPPRNVMGNRLIPIHLLDLFKQGPLKNPLVSPKPKAQTFVFIEFIASFRVFLWYTKT
ncbi:MAG: hypothetical protein CM1200mP16_16430 [Nitrospina sp.]|nr:MAG: hypothetical protein CM1200mP16_16430 [Nitrospina sp.]